MAAPAPACDTQRGCFGTDLLPGTVIGGLVGAVAALVLAAVLAAVGHDAAPYAGRPLAPILGTVPAWVQITQHLALSIAFAAPLVWGLRWCRGTPRVGGAVYGLLLWALLHETLLPQVFPGTAPSAPWASLAVHVVFGVAVVVGVERVAARVA